MIWNVLILNVYLIWGIVIIRLVIKAVSIHKLIIKNVITDVILVINVLMTKKTAKILNNICKMLKVSFVMKIVNGIK